MTIVDRYRAEGAKVRRHVHFETDPETKAALYRQARAGLELTLSSEVQSYPEATVRELGGKVCRQPGPMCHDSVPPYAKPLNPDEAERADPCDVC